MWRDGHGSASFTKEKSEVEKIWIYDCAVRRHNVYGRMQYISKCDK